MAKPLLPKGPNRSVLGTREPFRRHIYLSASAVEAFGGPGARDHEPAPRAADHDLATPRR